MIGVVQKIVRSSKEAKAMGEDELADDEIMLEENIVRIALIGTHVDRKGIEQDVFRRTLETVPEINANCFAMEGDNLTEFMRIIANVSDDKKKLRLGTYTLDEKAVAYLNGNKFFQRHAIIVGSTGSGKSWTTARILEQVAGLPNANALVFDFCTVNTNLLKSMGFSIYALPAQAISTKESLFRMKFFIFPTGCSAMKP